MTSDGFAVPQKTGQISRIKKNHFGNRTRGHPLGMGGGMHLGSAQKKYNAPIIASRENEIGFMASLTQTQNAS